MRPYHYTYILTVLDGIPDKEQLHECTEAVRLHWQAADFTAAGKPSDAIDLERRAISVFKRVSGTDGLIALSSANIGLAYGQIHRFKESIVACQSAISFLEQSPQLTNELATCLHTIGCSLLGLGEATDSLPYLKRAVKIWLLIKTGPHWSPKNRKSVTQKRTLLMPDAWLINKQAGVGSSVSLAPYDEDVGSGRDRHPLSAKLMVLGKPVCLLHCFCLIVRR